MARFKGINEATTALGYGTIMDYKSFRHGGGETTTGHIVWLPIMYEPDGNWFNLYNDTNVIKGEKELIIQIPNSETAFNDWKVNILGKTTCHVIVRTKIADNAFDYNEIGEYCDILYDYSKHITFCAKIGTTATIGKELNGDRLKWVSGFAATETEAREKMDKLIGPTLKVLKGI